MIATDLGRFLALGSIPIAYAVGGLTLVQLFVVTLASGILTVFFDVAYQSYLPALVGREHLVEGNAKLTGSAEVAAVAGPSVAGGLVQAIGGSAAVAVDAGSFLISAAGRGRCTRTRTETCAARGGAPQARSGDCGRPALCLRSRPAAGDRRDHRHLQLLQRRCRRGRDRLPCPPGPCVGGSDRPPLRPRWSRWRARRARGGPIARRFGGARATIIGIAGGVGALLIPLTMPGSGLLYFGFGSLMVSFSATVYNVNQVSFRQRLCPDRLLGRMNATMRFVVWGVLPIGALVGGVLGAVLGLRATLWVGALGQALAGIWLLVSPMRRLRDFPDALPE